MARTRTSPPEKPKEPAKPAEPKAPSEQEQNPELYAEMVAQGKR